MTSDVPDDPGPAERAGVAAPPGPALNNPKHGARHLLPRVIAVVGCDGAGKSTLTTDLHAHLGVGAGARLLYLGQDSGNILRGIKRLPLIGAPIGRYLESRSRRAHRDDGKSAEPDALTALVIVSLSHWRWRKFRRMLAMQRGGATVIVDRYPQAEAQGFYFDGPGLETTGRSSRLLCWLAAHERRLYKRMAAYVPGLLIRLNIDAETAHERKPDHKLAVLRAKARVLPTLTFNSAPILDLDATMAYPQVLQIGLAAAQQAVGLNPDDPRRQARPLAHHPRK